MIEFIFQYGLFLAKAITIVLAIVICFGLIVSIKQRLKKEDGYYEITDLGSELDDTRDIFENELLSKSKLKLLKKDRKRLLKSDKKGAIEKDRLFVVRFDGDIRANEVSELRKITTAILSIAQGNDEVLLVLESGGGFVPHYGLAASQLKRFRNAGIFLTVAIDKVAASGGYLMACVANKIIAAPFAIVGSIGVLGQLPNFNRFLNKHHIDFEQQHAGQYKRTLTMLGKNTDKGRKKFQEELEQTHALFKNFIDENRPNVDLEKIATGEHWHASDALSLNLIDVISTSDEYIFNQHPNKQMYEIAYKTKPDLKERLSSSIGMCFKKIQDQWLHWIKSPETRKL